LLAREEEDLLTLRINYKRRATMPLSTGVYLLAFAMLAMLLVMRVGEQGADRDTVISVPVEQRRRYYITFAQWLLW
jgi:hypothetical protein